ncbi:MAG TPA: glutathione S-transferase [Ottowia sp.]|uniref:glutathione S-transferase n=1 Tax=Ottowia sp. TaxID=1898956 RepID=UPI002CC65652|nr:glutathione S-transferase [Ottowia sp.]HMN22000.1 glutathione S-transferase [Ottowia sp.]
MLTLVGFSASNYYNVVKLALLEKQLPFQERLAWVGETDPAASPLGKVPYLLTDQGPISESTVILEYLEARYAAHPLLPVDPYQAAKVRELLRYSELHLELVARNLYPEAFFGGQVSERLKEKLRPELERHIAGFGQLARFAPYVAGDTFSLADCAAIAHLPLVASCSKIIYGQDLLAGLPVRDYLKRMGERASVQRVEADRKLNVAAMMAHMGGKA